MTAAQRHALELAVATENPVHLNTRTAKVLEDAGYLERDSAGRGWIPTDRGRHRIAMLTYEVEVREFWRHRATPAGRRLADRVYAFMDAHNLHQAADEFEGRRYVRVIVAADEAGIDPPAPRAHVHEGWANVARTYAKLLAEFDEEHERANARGVRVLIDYSVALSHPRDRARALEESKLEDDVVDLKAFRLRRVDQTPPAPDLAPRPAS